MRWLSARFLVGIVLMGFALVALTLSQETPRALAQEEKDKGAKEEKGEDREVKAFGTIGATQCARCHKGGRLDEETAVKLDKFIWLKEFSFWEKNDMHRYAFNCLSAPLGKQMAEILKYDVTKAKQCLVCHAVDLQHAGLTLPQELPAEDRFYTGYGMSCEACHGIANQRGEGKMGWRDPHANPDWRARPPQEKETKYNLLDMRNPQKRAEKCASCHVGNSAEGKVVTHDIFAAGHPPLQPLEIVTFAEQEPAHWYPGRKNEFLVSLSEGKVGFNFFGDPTDKKALSAEKQKATAAQNYYYIEGESKNVRDLVIGMVATLRSNVKLIQLEATKAVANTEILDFTHFDCYACHHDLVVPAGRQVRGYDGEPGRPLPKPWTNEVLKTVVSVWIKEREKKGAKPAVNRLQFEAALREFNAAMKAKPFGVPTEMQKAAAKFEGVLKTVLDEMGVVTSKDEMGNVKPGLALFDKPFVEALLTELRGKLGAKGQVGVTPYIDYEVAQLYAWTLKILSEEAKAMGINVGEADAAIKKLDSLDSKEKDATPALLIHLRQWTPDNSFMPIADRLAPRMNSVKNFDSLGFRKLFD